MSSSLSVHFQTIKKLKSSFLATEVLLDSRDVASSVPQYGSRAEIDFRLNVAFADFSGPESADTLNLGRLCSTFASRTNPPGPARVAHRERG